MNERIRTAARRRRVWRLAAASGAIVAVVAGQTASAGGTATRVAETEGAPLRIGLLLSSEGPFANNSDTARRGAEYAVEKINDDGGVDGRPIELVTADSHGQPDQLATIIPRLATEDDVLAVVGPEIGRAHV